jgi:putative flavoprotein involved in K+ transport
LSYALKQREISHLLLERGETVGESWRRMPRHWKLVSPWKTNSLPGTAKHLWPRHAVLSREEFLHYLQSYARTYELPVRVGVEVQSVQRVAAGRFQVRTSRGDLFSRMVVNATGYFARPFLPEIGGRQETRIPQLHVADYRDADNVKALLGKATGSVLIVGQRLSAGQALVELSEAGFEVMLSHRSPIRYGVGPLGWWILFRTFPWLEWIKLQALGVKAPSNDVRMQGGPARKLIESGRVKTYPEIRQFEQDRIRLMDGRYVQPDLVLFATGFRAALGHLAALRLPEDKARGLPELRDLESVAMPGLFFIGLDHARNFRSRFIRGIRQDAVFLADRLARDFK